MKDKIEIEEAQKKGSLALRSEERDTLTEFGEENARYTDITPAFIPPLRGATQVTQH